MSARRHPEQDFQIRIVRTVLQPLDALGRITVVAIPNGYKRTRAEAGIAKAMGQRAGAWDIAIWKSPESGGGCFGLEFKAPDGRPTAAQGDFARRMRDLHGCRTWLVATDAEVMAALEREGVLR